MNGLLSQVEQHDTDDHTCNAITECVKNRECKCYDREAITNCHPRITLVSRSPDQRSNECAGNSSKTEQTDLLCTKMEGRIGKVQDHGCPEHTEGRKCKGIDHSRLS